MKKFITFLTIALAFIALAQQKNDDFFGPIIPQNTLKSVLKASYTYTDTVGSNVLVKANEYTDSKSVAGDITALSNRVVKLEGDTVVISNAAETAQATATAAQTTANAALPNTEEAMTNSAAFANAVAVKAPVTSVNGQTGAVTTRSFEEFPASWKAVAENKTMEEFFAAVRATNPDAGHCFLGGMARMTPAPTPTLLSGNYEATIEVPVKGVYVIKVTSTNNSPYYWMATWDITFSGWRQICNAETPTEAGEYTLKCVVGNTGVVMMQWVKDNP